MDLQHLIARLERASERLEAHTSELKRAHSILAQAQTAAAEAERRTDEASEALGQYRKAVGTRDNIKIMAHKCIPADLPDLLRPAFLDALMDCLKRTMLPEETSVRMRAVTTAMDFDTKMQALTTAQVQFEEVERDHAKALTAFKAASSALNAAMEEFNAYTKDEQPASTPSSQDSPSQQPQATSA